MFFFKKFLLLFPKKSVQFDLSTASSHFHYLKYPLATTYPVESCYFQILSAYFSRLETMHYAA